MESHSLRAQSRWSQIDEPGPHGLGTLRWGCGTPPGNSSDHLQLGTDDQGVASRLVNG